MNSDMTQSNQSPYPVNTTPREIDSVEKDVAENYHRERMRIDTPRRMTYQRFFVRPSRKDNAKTTITYDALSDITPKWRTSIPPAGKETQARNDTVPVVVVGLVIADEPLKYSTTGTGQKAKSKGQDRRARGILPRPSKVLRAVTPVTEYIESKSKFYVAVNPTDGLCDLRVIPSEAIFFFPEYFTSICSSQPDHNDEEDDVTENDETEDDLTLLSVMPTTRSTASSAANPPDVGGLRRFLDSSVKTFTPVDAALMVQALKITCPYFPTMDPNEIAEVRKILQRMSQLEYLSSNSVLAMYLKMLNTHIEGKDRFQFEGYVLETVDMARCASEHKLQGAFPP